MRKAILQIWATTSVRDTQHANTLLLLFIALPISMAAQRGNLGGALSIVVISSFVFDYSYLTGVSPGALGHHASAHCTFPASLSTWCTRSTMVLTRNLILFPLFSWQIRSFGLDIRPYIRTVLLHRTALTSEIYSCRLQPVFTEIVLMWRALCCCPSCL